eukprot:794367-Rhodomonas_salina.2
MRADAYGLHDATRLGVLFTACEEEPIPKDQTKGLSADPRLHEVLGPVLEHVVHVRSVVDEKVSGTIEPESFTLL